ncbi:unnamed protein product [Dovyalis caffra]|uniref:Leucine-rich repeat-containing N-terminal plant-type domain-containing protein n=1 Tax=Dovyalis caffra TaxID=77055 RepID=A0AAV1SXT3_9ROSI|nr:unnamed protein product [Dovyalis caffra]
MFAFPSVYPKCHRKERSALLQFKESFIISGYACKFPFANPKVESWKLEGNVSDCCSWDGVKCDEDTGHVIGLNLNASCLYGSIGSNSSLFHLVHLQKLNLANNDFNGSQIPSALGNLSELTTLDLSNSLFFGNIPSEISKLSRLTYLALYSNYNPFSERFLKLKMPYLRSLVQNLTNLEFLGLGSVDMPFPIPNIFANFSSLKFLTLVNVGLLGKFPETIFQLPNLLSLQVGRNQDLTGHLPASIGNLRSLKALAIDSCNFSGVIPFSLGNLSRLTVLVLGNNSFRGQIPSTFANLTQLTQLSFGLNNWSGTVNLDAFLPLKRLRTLDLSFSNLVFDSKTSTNGTLPKLEVLSLASCSLNHFPRFLQKQNKLTWLDLSSNNLHGKVPSWMWTMSTETLELLDLSHNFLTGLDQPTAVLPWSQLRVLDLSSNMLQGSLLVPPFSTIHYSVSNNSLAGNIPPSICKVDGEDQLIYMQADTSISINGQWMPHYFAYSMTLTNKGLEMDYEKILEIFIFIDLSCNKFEGEIPEFIGNLKGLRLLNLSDNILSGFIPSSIGNLAKLEALDLSQNRLSGKIPQQLVQLTFLEIFNVSHNHLAGPIPRGNQFNTFQNNSFDGNPGLCGVPLSKKCGNLNALTAPALAPADEPLRLDWKFVAIGYGSGFVVGVVMGHIVTKRKHDWFMKSFWIGQQRRQRRTWRRRGN